MNKIIEKIGKYDGLQFAFPWMRSSNESSDKPSTKE